MNLFDKFKKNKGASPQKLVQDPNVKKDWLYYLDKALEKDAIISILVVVFGFLFGTLLILLVGKNPAGMYSAIWQTITGHNPVNGRYNIRYV